MRADYRRSLPRSRDAESNRVTPASATALFASASNADRFLCRASTLDSSSVHLAELALHYNRCTSNARHRRNRSFGLYGCLTAIGTKRQFLPGLGSVIQCVSVTDNRSFNVTAAQRYMIVLSIALILFQDVMPNLPTGIIGSYTLRLSIGMPKNIWVDRFP